MDNMGKITINVGEAKKDSFEKLPSKKGNIFF